MKRYIIPVLIAVLLTINITLFTWIKCSIAADFTIKITPEHVGVFLSNNTQQFTANAIYPSNSIVDITDQVDWYVEENGFDEQPLAEETITIDQQGKAEGLTSWGRVNISACYPKGCKIPIEPPEPPPEPEPGIILPTLFILLFPEDAEAAAPFNLTINESNIITATTTMTLMDIINWRAPDNRDKAIASMPVVTPITFVSIAYNRITWTWEDGFDGLLWAFYSDDGNKTYKAWGWDYVTKHHYLKSLEGYPRGWVGTAIGSCGACNGYPQATTVYFTETY